MLDVEGDLSFITYHPTSQWPTKYAPATGYEQYKDVKGSSKWLKMDAVQSSHECIDPVPGAGRWCGSRNYEPIELMWNNSLGKRPIMDLENHYEGGWYNIQPGLSGGRVWNDSDIRTGAWTAVSFFFFSPESQESLLIIIFIVGLRWRSRCHVWGLVCLAILRSQTL